MNVPCYFNPFIFLWINTKYSFHFCKNCRWRVVGASTLVPRYQVLMGICTTPLHDMDKGGMKRKRIQRIRLTGIFLVHTYGDFCRIAALQIISRKTHWSMWGKVLHFLTFPHNNMIVSYLMLWQIIHLLCDK